ncbi:hypothetical protein NDN08_006429 [Rhodosorus marinus]|uniref:Chloride conductance regulatory protein ICln n=1 Tax=Rhodosorus marinus TaxID=101924 RepID=A0AAV8UM69_9RHOD|nr:hypothetical protein NDN08_006429 [Rhodosorus marinus]
MEVPLIEGGRRALDGLDLPSDEEVRACLGEVGWVSEDGGEPRMITVVVTTSSVYFWDDSLKESYSFSDISMLATMMSNEYFDRACIYFQIDGEDEDEEVHDVYFAPPAALLENIFDIMCSCSALANDHSEDERDEAFTGSEDAANRWDEIFEQSQGNDHHEIFEDVIEDNAEDEDGTQE